MRFTLAILLSIFFATTSSMGQTKVVRANQTISSGGFTYYMHKITKGQTLEQLATAYNVSEESILAKNPFANTELKPKQVLLIPTEQSFKRWGQKQAPHKDVEPVDTLTTIVVEDTIKTEPEVVRTGRTKEFDTNSPINVAVILPFSEPYSSSSNANFSDFYRGVLVALNELKIKGISTNIEVLSCGARGDNTQNETSVQKIIDSGVLDEMNLIIGPVYQDAFIPVAQYATQKRIPIVSPLAIIDGVDTPFVFQAAPTEDAKFDKLGDIFRNPTANVVVFKHVGDTDENMVAEVRKLAPGMQIVDESSSATMQSITALMDSGKENIIVAPIANELAVSTLLQKIYAVNSTLRFKITVVGLSRWARFKNINIETFFNLNTFYVVNYHEDRTNDLVVKFYTDYIRNFGSLPSLFSMRGYDVTLMFVSALAKWGPDMPLHFDRFNPELLQVKYNFKQASDESSFVNQEWMLVNYTPNNEIIVR